MKRTFLASAVRTPLGSFQGSLHAYAATDLGAIAVREAVARAGIPPDAVQEVIMGCVLSAGLGQSPAKQAALKAGLPEKTGVLTINKVCSSGLRSVMLADQIIRAGDASICVAGGMESMSNAPYLLPQARSGYRLGDGAIVDSLIFDGLRDAFDGHHMGIHAERCVQHYRFTRQEQDAFAIESYRRAQRALAEGSFRDEIVAVEHHREDEEPGRVKFDKVASLKPVFEKEGTITVANASSLSDGAAALVVMAEAEIKNHRIAPLASIVAHSQASQAPAWFTTAPIKAIQAVLAKANLQLSDIDYFEINEAFAAVVLAAMRELHLDHQRVNVHGGAVALGHPLGATGARLLTTMMSVLRQRQARLGLVALCNGGGEATAMIVERV